MPPRKSSYDSYESPKKKGPGTVALIKGELRRGEIIADNTGRKWKLGKAIGIGGFGEIYDVLEHSPKENQSCSTYVAKIEKHSNGPLFVEVNCYLRMGKLEMIENWKKKKNLSFLGVPHFIASGSHFSKGEKYRFLILPKYDEDLDAIFQKKRNFNLKTVLVIASRIIDTLEYIHSHGYVHSDIKASNIMLGHSQTSKRLLKLRSPVRKSPIMNLRTARPIVRTCKHNLRPVYKLNYIDDIPYLDDVLNEHEERRNKNRTNNNESNEVETVSSQSKSKGFEGDQVYLLDFGLASKYLLSSGEHREFTSDQRRAHAGTILFCSRDAHKGIPTCRSDLESLAYNMIYWLTGSLPWIDDVQEPEIVEKKKNRFFTDVKTFLEICFEDCPRFLVEMFNYLGKLQFKDHPNYNFFRILFKKTIKDYGYKDDLKLDFDNLEGWGRKQKKVGKVKSNKKENKSIFKRPSILLYSPRKPLSSNIIFKRPKLRKKIKDKLAKNSMMNWSRILIMDPETIIKQGGHRKNTDNEGGVNILELDLDSLNPTPAMREVFNKASERQECSPYGSRGDELCTVDNIDGYTSEMMRVHRRMIEQREMELEKVAQISFASKKRSKKRVKRSESPVRPRSKPKVTEGLFPSLNSLKRVKSIPLKRTYSLRG